MVKVLWLIGYSSVAAGEKVPSSFTELPAKLIPVEDVTEGAESREIDIMDAAWLS